MNAGDTVTRITFYHGNATQMDDRIIKRITPTGRVVLDTNEVFVDGEKYGWKYGSSSRFIITQDADTIQKARDQILKKKIIGSLNTIRWEYLSLEVLKDIYNRTQEEA